MISASVWYSLAETNGSARGDFSVTFGGYSVSIRAIVSYNSSSIYILSNNVKENTLVSFRIRRLSSSYFVDVKFNEDVDIAYSIENNTNWVKSFSVSGTGKEVCAINNINGVYSDSGNIDYKNVVNKPAINNVELKPGNNTLDELSIQPKGEYVNKDDFDKFKTFFGKLFEYDAEHNAIKARLDFYTDTDKCISAGGLNSNTGEIEFISSYSKLKDKPFINGQELLSGENSLDKLGIQPKGDYTTNAFVESITSAIIEKLNLHIKDFEDFVNTLNTYFQFDSEHQAIKVLYDLYTDNGKNISAGGYGGSGTEITIPKSYDELTDKPSINGVELKGNLTSEDLGLQLGGDYLTVSDILNNIKQADGTTKQYIKSELLPEVTSNKGIEVLQTASKTQIDLIVDTDTFSFGENKELQIKKIDGGIFL